MLAAHTGDNKLVLQLKENGADITVKTKRNRGSTEDRLMALNLEGDKYDDVYDTALSEACAAPFVSYDNDKMVERSPETYAALIHRSGINQRHYHGKTSLHIAAENRNYVAVRELVKAGANILLTDNDSKIPLQLALEAFRIQPLDDAILQLIPIHQQLNSTVILNALVNIDKRTRLMTPQVQEIFARILLQTESKYSFRLNIVYDGRVHYWDVSEKENTGQEITNLLLDAIGVLVRRGLGSRISPVRLDYFLPGLQHHTIHPDMPNAPERFFKSAEDIDALFAVPLTLLDECCFKIRSTIQNPKHENIRQLQLPKRISDKLLFVELMGEIFDLMRRDLKNEYTLNDPRNVFRD